MARPPLTGYNHNLRYQERVYHVQTEDYGRESAKVHTHLFHDGTVLASAQSDYSNLEPDAADYQLQLTRLMQAQHKRLIRELLHGAFDRHIEALLGQVKPAPTEQRLQRFSHRLAHHGRTYTIETTFFATVSTEVFFEEVLIDAVLTDSRAAGLAGGKEIAAIAQAQHKQAIRGLRDGGLDTRIKELLGTLAAPRAGGSAHPGRLEALQRALKAAPESSGPASTRAREPSVAVAQVSRHEHQYRYRGHLFRATTTASESQVEAELCCGSVVLTRNVVTRAETPADLGALAKTLHRQLLVDLRAGQLDETIELMEEMDLDLGDGSANGD